MIQGECLRVRKPSLAKREGAHWTKRTILPAFMDFQDRSGVLLDEQGNTGKAVARVSNSAVS